MTIQRTLFSFPFGLNFLLCRNGYTLSPFQLFVHPRTNTDGKQQTITDAMNALAILTLDSIERQLERTKTGDIILIDWSDVSDPDRVISWKCVVQSKPTATSATFTSVDADDPQEVWDMPQLAEGDEDYADDDDKQKNGKLAILYRNITLPVRPAKKSMAGSKTRFLARSSIVGWKKSTWMPHLNATGAAGALGRELVVSEIFRQLDVPEQMNAARFTRVDEHECAVLGEVLIGVVDLLRRLEAGEQDLREINQILNPVIRRLCEHKAAKGLLGDKRTKAMAEVHEAFVGDALRGDKISQIMMGVKAPLTGRGNGGE